MKLVCDMGDNSLCVAQLRTLSNFLDKYKAEEFGSERSGAITTADAIAMDLLRSACLSKNSEIVINSEVMKRWLSVTEIDMVTAGRSVLREILKKGSVEDYVFNAQDKISDFYDRPWDSVDVSRVHHEVAPASSVMLEDTALLWFRLFKNTENRDAWTSF